MVTTAENSQDEAGEGGETQTHLKAPPSPPSRVPTLVCERTKREAAAYKRGALEVPRARV